MPLSIKHLAQRPRQQKSSTPIVFDDFRFGLNTSLSSAAISPKELSICVNLKILPLGGLETREGLTRYTTSVLANPASFAAYFPTEVDIGDVGVFVDTDDGIWKDTDDGDWVSEVPASTAADELVVTKTDNKLYYLSAAKAPVLITALQGEATIIPFGSVALILDGSYIKVWDKSTGAVTLAYDDGTGVNGYQHDNTGLTADTDIKLYSGGNTKVGVRFETQSWDARYTIAATQVDVYLKKVGSPTGNVGCELYTDAGVLVATSDTIISAADIDTTAELRNFVFSSGDMSQRTIYWAVITFSGDPLGAEKVTDGVFEAVTKAAAKNVTGITKATPGVVTFAAAHGYANGDVIYFSGLNEMTELNTEYWVLRSNAGDTFEFQTTVGNSLDTIGYGAAETTGGACAQKCDFTSWTEGAGYYPAVDGAGALTNKANAVAVTADLEQDVSAVAGETYRVVFTLSGFSGTSVTPQVGGVDGTVRSSNATFTEEITATGTGNLKFQGDALTGQIDTVSVKKVENYIQVECDTVASGGDGKYYDSAPSWQDDAAKFLLMAIKPGRPPRARFGLIDGSRVYVAGDPSNKGLMWYCNVNDCYDWSTVDGGGYVGAIDDNAQSFPIGAIVAQYGDIYLFGQASQPYICKLTGDSPSDYALPPLFQRVYSTHKTALQIINDIWSGSAVGVNALSGVEQYGDLRTFSESDAVDDRIRDYWTDDDAFAGYNGTTGQYFLKMTGYPRCLVLHTKAPVPDKRGRLRYPGTEYVFIRDDLSSATYKWTLVQKIINGDMELDSNWNDYGSPSLNERSSEQAHGGTYSRKFTGAYNAGIKSDTFTTVTGQEYTGEFWIYPVDCTEFNIFIKRGDDSGNSYGAYGISGLTANTWNKYEFTYPETAGGSSAYIALYKANTYYVDDVSIILPDNYHIKLAVGGDPSLTEPPYLLLDDSIATAGTLGSLADHEWAYGDNDGLGYSTIYVRDDSGDPNTTGVQIKTVLEPTMFASYQNTFFVGFDDGYIYELDSTVVQDNSIDVPYTMAPKLLESPFNDVCLEKYNVSHGSDATGVTADLEIYDQKVDIDDLDSVDADVTESIAFDTQSNGDINVNYNNFQAVLRNIDPNGEPLQINSILLKARPLSE